MSPELLKEILIMVHAMCVSVGMVVAYSAHAYAMATVCRAPLTTTNINIIVIFHRTIKYALYLIWISGAVLLYFAIQANPEMVYNAKFYAKIFVVIVISIDACMMQMVFLPHIKRHVGKFLFAGESKHIIFFSSFAGGLSIVSWGYVFVLGSLRYINVQVAPLDASMSKVSMFYEFFIDSVPFLTLYFILLAGAVVAAAVITVLVSSKNKVVRSLADHVFAVIRLKNDP